MAMYQIRGASDIEPETPEYLEDQPTLPTAAVAAGIVSISATSSSSGFSTCTGSNRVESDSESDHSAVVSLLQWLCPEEKGYIPHSQLDLNSKGNCQYQKVTASESPKPPTSISLATSTDDALKHR